MIRPLTGNLKAAALCPANDKSVDTSNTQFLKYEEALTSQRMEGMTDLRPSQRCVV